jgi:hypothetical protein
MNFLVTDHQSYCFTHVKYVGFISFHLLWRCTGQNDRRIDVVSLVYFRRIQLLVCNPSQETTVSDSGRACHTLEDSQTAGKMRCPALEGEARY